MSSPRRTAGPSSSQAQAPCVSPATHSADGAVQCKLSASRGAAVLKKASAGATAVGPSRGHADSDTARQLELWQQTWTRTQRSLLLPSCCPTPRTEQERNLCCKAGLAPLQVWPVQCPLELVARSFTVGVTHARRMCTSVHAGSASPLIRLIWMKCTVISESQHATLPQPKVSRGPVTEQLCSFVSSKGHGQKFDQQFCVVSSSVPHCGTNCDIQNAKTSGTSTADGVMISALHFQSMPVHRQGTTQN